MCEYKKYTDCEWFLLLEMNEFKHVSRGLVIDRIFDQNGRDSLTGWRTANFISKRGFIDCPILCVCMLNSVIWKKSDIFGSF